MAGQPEPIVLELAHLPREQMGPFLVLGLDKNATREEIEAHWADRVRWARKGQISIPLEDVNWARERLSDVAQRLQADAASLNVDTADGFVRQLRARYGADPTRQGPLWEPLDEEKPLADYNLPVEVPTIESVRGSLMVPPVPQEMPAVTELVRRWAEEPLDPWALEL